ncbi:MAG: F0F1 ATP synthase subunit epsilon, partial [Alphaproteobacteria bacterium]|nr:F0F1 ATP synthase subunit epsilon [Alphaproteobacteria bacterium]
MAEAPATGQLTAELVTPEQLLFADSVTMVVVPGVEGDFGVLPGHAPLISQVRPGVVDFHLTDGDLVLLGGGHELLPGDRQDAR